MISHSYFFNMGYFEKAYVEERLYNHSFYIFYLIEVTIIFIYVNK